MDDIISRGIERVYEAFPDAYDSRDPAFLDALNDVVLEALQSPDLTREVVTMPRPRKERKERIEPDKPYIGTREAAQILGVSETIVKRMLGLNEIPSAYQVDGKHWIMLRSDIQTLAERRK